MFAQWIDATDEQSLWTAYSQNFRPDADAFREAIDKIRLHWNDHPNDDDPTYLDSIWSICSPDRSPRFLMEMIKFDQAERLKAGLPIDLGIYFDRFPDLKSEDVRVVSLAYAEFCALEESGKPVSVDSFCEKYANWGDSIRRQLALHEMMSIPSNELGGHEQARHFPKVGECVEHFELIRELGRGGSARVFLAQDLSLGRRAVALKISGDRSTEPEILARLDHANIVPVHSVHDAPNGLRLICMPFRGELTLDRVFSRLFVEGKPAPTTAREFRVAIEQKQPTAGENALDDGPENGWRDFPSRGDFCQAVAWIGWKLAQALAHAHSSDVFHRDIKPANILISLKSGPQLLDFNMARDPEAVQTVEDRIRGGTLPYMAPEQLGAFLDASLWAEIRETSDIYSLGLVLEEFLRGKRVEVPLAGKVPVKSQVRALLRQRNLPRINLRSHNPNVPHALEAILAKATAFRPVDRYRTADEFAEDLQRFRTGRPLKHAFNPSRTERLKSRLRPALKPALIAVSLFVLSYTLRQSGESRAPIPTIPGVRSDLIEAFRSGDFVTTLRLVGTDRPSPNAETNTVEDLIRLISMIESNPGNPEAEEQIKDLTLRPDLDESVAQLQGVIGENRHLDFLPAFRDYCRLSNDLANNPGGNLEWQNLERRFLRLIEKWPADIRYHGFTAHMASMRSDYVAAKKHVSDALNILDKMPPDDFRTVRNDLRTRLVLYSHTIGMKLLKDDKPAEAKPELESSLSAIRQLRDSAGDDIRSVDSEGRLDYLQIVNRIGLADVQFELQDYDAANAQYEDALSLLKKYASSPWVAVQKAQLEGSIQQRQDRIRSLDPDSGLITQEPKR
ncbi:protein kinase [bacterium]|nr:protein kinase [bacterium]